MRKGIHLLQWPSGLGEREFKDESSFGGKEPVSLAKMCSRGVAMPQSCIGLTMRTLCSTLTAVLITQSKTVGGIQ
jgi:hypothetical protein